MQDKNIETIREVFSYSGEIDGHYNEALFELAENYDSICKEINTLFCNKKEEIREKIVEIVGHMIAEYPKHFVITPDSFTPWDCSGELHESGLINMSISLWDFLENEYTGDKEPTFISGCGWRYLTYGDKLSYETLQIGEDILHSALDKYILKYKFDENDDWFVRDIVHDTFYDDTLTNEFFFWERVMNYIGITKDNSPSLRDFAMMSDTFKEAAKKNNILLFPGDN